MFSPVKRVAIKFGFHQGTYATKHSLSLLNFYSPFHLLYIGKKEIEHFYLSHTETFIAKETSLIIGIIHRFTSVNI